MKKASIHTSHGGAQAKRVPNERLKAQRLKKNWTQVYVATQIGANDTEVSRWETGSAVPSLYFREKLCALFHMTPEELGLVSSAEESAQEEDELSPALWCVPYQRNPFFTGRAAFLHTLDQRLGAQRTSPGSQRLAITGLGGMGKTQLALEYAYQHMFDYRAVFWVAAETPDTIAASLTTIAEHLHLPESREKDHRLIAQAVLRWLTTHPQWLLIFDNVEAPALLRPLLPETRYGAILVTTRLRSLEGLAPLMDLLPFSPEEGRRFLLRRAGLLGQEEAAEHLSAELSSSADTLVAAMGGLPLALDQAGAYIERTGCDLQSYLRLSQSHPLELLSERPEVAEHPLSVVKTLLFSFHTVAQTNPAAADLLRICAFLAPEAIPEGLFVGEAAPADLVPGVVTRDAHQWNLLLGDILKHSLLQRSAQQATLSLHRLVQLVVRSTMDELTARQWAGRAAALVGHCTSQVRADAFDTHNDEYLPHARTVLQHIAQWDMWDEPALLAPLYFYIGQVAEQYSELTEAREAYQQGLACLQKSTHPLEAALRAHLGYVLSYMGDDEQGLRYLEQGADLARKQQDTFTLCFALLFQGEILDNRGQYQQAEAVYQEGLVLARRIHNEHTASAFLQNVGVQASRRGEYARAIELFREGMSYVQQSNQVNRRSALLLTLGMAELCQKQYEQALADTQESLRLAQQVRQGYLICAATQNLGIIYRHLGQMEQARRYLQESLAQARQMQHPWLRAEAQGELGWLHLEQQQWEAAETLFHEMLATARALQAPQLQGRALFGLAHVAAHRNHLEQARTLALESIGHFRQVEDTGMEEVAQWLATLPAV